MALSFFVNGNSKNRIVNRCILCLVLESIIYSLLLKGCIGSMSDD